MTRATALRCGAIPVLLLLLGGCASKAVLPELAVRSSSNGDTKAIAEAAAQAATSELAQPETTAPRPTGGPGARPTPQPVAVAAAAAAQAAAQAAQRERPFADVVKDAKDDEGLFRIWTRDDR